MRVQKILHRCILSFIAFIALASCKIESIDDIDSEVTINDIRVSSLVPSSDTKSCTNFATVATERDVTKAYFFINKIQICWGAGQPETAFFVIREANLKVPAGTFSAYTKTLDDVELSYAINIDSNVGSYPLNTVYPVSASRGTDTGILRPTVISRDADGVATTGNTCATLNSHQVPTCGRLIFGGLTFAGAQPNDPPPTSVYEIGTLTISGEVEDGDDIRAVEGKSELIISR